MPEYYDPNAWMTDFEPELQTFDFGNSLEDLVDMPDFDFGLGDGYASEDAPWYQDVWNFVGSNWRDLLGAGMSLGSGAIGAGQAGRLADLARQAFGQSDPFASQRAGYQQQLRDLMANPSSIFQESGFLASQDLGEQAVRRAMSTSGHLGSGNEMYELQRFSQSLGQDYLNTRINQLSTLAGAGISPNFGAALGAQGASSDLLSQALAAMGYGVGGLLGTNRPQGQVTAGGAGGLTPASGQQRPFSSAGGEAAELAQYLRLGAGVTNLVGGVSGNDFSGISGTLSGASGVLGGIARGDTQGYIGAARSGLSTADRLGAGDWAGTASTALGALTGAYGVTQGIQNINGNPIGAINTLASGARVAGSVASLAGGGALASGGAVASGAAANAALAQAGFGGAAGAGAGAAGGGAAASLGALAGSLGVMGAVVAAPAIVGSFASRGDRERTQEVEQYFASGAVNRMGIGQSFTNIQLPDGRVLVNPTRDNQIQLARAFASGDTARYNSELDRVYNETRGSYQMQQGDPRWRQPGTINSITPNTDFSTLNRMNRPTNPRTGQRE